MDGGYESGATTEPEDTFVAAYAASLYAEYKAGMNVYADNDVTDSDGETLGDTDTVSGTGTDTELYENTSTGDTSDDEMDTDTVLDTDGQMYESTSTGDTTDDVDTVSVSGKTGDTTVSDASDDDCPICRKSMGDNTFVAVCKHTFCIPCYDSWVQMRVQMHEQPSCAVCRAALPLPPHLSAPPAPLPDVIVHGILGHGYIDGRLHVLIHWLGHDNPTDHTWEPVDENMNCALILDYLDTLNKCTRCKQPGHNAATCARRR